MAFYPPQASCQELVLTANVQLDYPYSANTGNVIVTDMIDVSSTNPNLNIFLPDSTLTGPGFSVTFNNVGTNSFNVVLNDRVTVLTAIVQGAVLTVYLYSNSNANGNWRVIPFGSGVNAISSLNLTSTDSSVIVTNGSITPPGGTINVGLPAGLLSLITTLTASIPGIVSVSKTNNQLVWKVLSLNGGSNITITNPDGSTGNPVVNLNNNISVAQMTAGNVIINNDLITNTDANGVLNITSNGSTSSLNLNSVLVDVGGNMSNINNLTINGKFQSPNVAKAWCRFSNTSGTISTISVFNVSQITYNSGNHQYTIAFISPMGNTNYSVFISCAANNSTSPLQTRIGYDVIRQLDSVVIILTDSSGEILQDAPEGVSVMIFSLT